jgi:hypothetical protein
MANQKGFNNSKQESATMYAKDLTKFTYVLLMTTQMTFEIS